MQQQAHCPLCIFGCALHRTVSHYLHVWLSIEHCACRNAAEARVAAIGVELQERESNLTRQLQSHQASASGQISQLTSDNTRLKHDLDTAMAQVC